jgi:serine/threonine protein phosphatase PrpC
LTAIRAAAQTHTGYVRSNNEDLAVVSSDLAAIADGMGGHLGGEVAARTAIEELVEAFQRDRTASGLVAAVRRANRAIWRRSRVDRKLHGMGTTLTAVALVAGEGDAEGSASHLALVNIGDSRAYRLDYGAEDTPVLTQLTVDHSLVEEMVRQGELTPDEAAVHPHRHVLTRALGIDPEVDMDVWDLEPSPGTRLLLCSDGLTDEVPEDEIARVLASAEDPHEVARELVGRALGHGGLDNVTVVVVDVLEDRAPGDEQALEMVPPRPPMPDIGTDERGADVTQSMPVTRARKRRGDGAAGKAAPGLSAAAAAGSLDPSTDQIDVADPSGPPNPSARPSDSRDPPATAEPSAGERSADPTVEPSPELYDGELDDDPPPLESGTTLEDDSDQELPAGDDAGEGAARVRGGAAHRRGRSMTVRATVPASLAEASTYDSAEGVTGSHARSTVFVPTRGLSKQYRDRIVTFRVFLFILVLAGLGGGVVGVVTWFQSSAYYVGLSGDRVSIFQGRPGGLLWFKPQLLETSDVTTNNLLPNSVTEVQRGIAESSYAAAKQEVSDLVRLSNELGMGPGGSTTTTTVRLGSLAGAQPLTVTSSLPPTPTTAKTRAATTTSTSVKSTTTSTSPKSTNSTSTTLKSTTTSTTLKSTTTTTKPGK